MNFLYIVNDRETEQDDYRTALKSPEVRRIFRRLLRESMYFSSSYAKGDAMAMAHNEGLRRMGQYLAEKIEAAQQGALAGLMQDGTRELAINQ